MNLTKNKIRKVQYKGLREGYDNSYCQTSLINVNLPLSQDNRATTYIPTKIPTFD
jgi:hypothetical protein